MAPARAGGRRLGIAVAISVWIAGVLSFSAVVSPSPESLTDPAPTPAIIRNLLDDGRFPEAEELARTLLAERETAYGSDSLEVAEDLDLLLEAQWQREDTDERALERARQAVAIKERLLPPGDASLAKSLNNLGRILILRGEYQAAKPICERGLSVAESALGPENPRVAENLSTLGELLYSTGDYAESGQLYERAISILKKQLGPDDPKVARALWDWSATLLARGDSAGAKAALERALVIQQKSLRPDHPEVAETLNMMGNVLWADDDRAEANRFYERGAAVAERALGADSPRMATILWNLADGRTFYDLDYAEARRLLQRVLAIYEKVYGRESRQYAYSEVSLGTILSDVGDFPEAERSMRHGVQVLERVLG